MREPSYGVSERTGGTFAAKGVRGGVVAGVSAAGGVKIAAAIHSETDCSGGKEASLPADMIVSNRISVKGAPSLRFSVRDYRN